MKFIVKTLAVFSVTLTMAATPAFAEKPDHAGKGKDKPKAENQHKHKSSNASKGMEKSAKGNNDSDLGRFLVDDKRDIIRSFYADEFKAGNCPPGLAKKNNGCMPPGQAKKWQVGHPLPHDLIYHDLPDELLRRLGRTPEGYKLVRVGTDILKIGVGTGLVIEAVEDLGGLF